ncbi:MAG: YgeY family selenium metabolism-linked hydrolase [Candidatus Heimdallarchaeota archaeon]|nr:MAG: YgeY family selenium metabolism-linked hydrolase [Candidatus Heimdallarchaeota archaeon]
MKTKIKNAAKSLKQTVTDFTRELIAIPSTTGNEVKVITRIKKEMEKIGYDDIQVDGMGNLLGKIGSGEKILAIDGHVDTVEVGDPQSWEYNPFKGKFEDGIIFGRGACDQKGGLASVIYTGNIIKETGIPEDITLYIVASVQEEIYEGLNWQYIIKEDKLIPDAVILSEPSNLNVAIGHRGRADVKIHATGISSHGAAPELGNNAIYKIAPIILDIEKMDSGLKVDPIFGKGNVSVTDICSTSPSINATADSSTIHIDRRLTSEDSEESVLNEIKSLDSVRRSKADVYVPEHKYQSKDGIIYPVKAYYPSWYMEESHPLVQIAIKTFEVQFDSSPELYYWRFSTNGVATKGIFNIPTIGFGPGDDKFAHTTEDQVPTEHLVKAMEFYSQFIKLWGES